METQIYQVLATLLTVIAVFIGIYVKVSDSIEKETKKPYPIHEFWKLSWTNGLYQLLSAYVLLIFLNEAGIAGLKTFIDFPLEFETIGKMSIAIFSGLIGHKVLNKFY